MSPRRSVADARRTRDAIVDRAVEIASLEGLEGLTIGRLAGDVGMSKAGLLGHFGTKERLQLAALEAAIDTFRETVWEPVAGAAPGRERLLAIVDAWIDYLDGGVFPGGCFLTAASCEFDGRGGPVRDAVADALARWRAVIAHDARAAVRAGQLPAGTDPAQVAFELNALAMGTNQAIQLHGDRDAGRRARLAARRILAAG